MEPERPFAGIRYLILAVASFVLMLPIAGCAAGIAVHFLPAGWDATAVGLGTAIYSVLAIFLLGLIFLTLAFAKGGKSTRKLCCALTALGVLAILGMWLWSYW